MRFLTVLLGAVAASAALAAPAPTPTATPTATSAVVAPDGQKPAEKQVDHDKPICCTIPVLGSRLQRNRVCMTKAEWAEQRLQDRMLIERSQMRACTPGANC